MGHVDEKYCYKTRDILNFNFCLCVYYVYIYMCQGIFIELKRHFLGVCSLHVGPEITLKLSVKLGDKFLPTEPSCWPSFFIVVEFFSLFVLCI